MWATLALSAALNLAPAQGGLELKNARFTHGILGQDRKDASVLPGDILVLGFDIDGLTVGKDNRILYSMGMELINDKGQKPFAKDPEDLETYATLGGSRVPAFAMAQVGLDTPPGEYTCKVTVVDRGANPKRTESVERKFTVQKPQFGIVRTGFTYGTGEPAPPLAVVGQSLLLNFTAVAFELTDKKQPDMTAQIQVTDEAGKSTLNQPIQIQVPEINAEAVKLRVWPAQFPLSVTRAGNFKITVTINDRFAKKKAEVTMDLKAIEMK
jgi:hypothetical protein